MQSFSSCLYRVSASKNYYFRVRFAEFERLARQPLSNSHFVASLKTADPDEALLLARYLLTHLKRAVARFTPVELDVTPSGVTHHSRSFKAWFKAEFLLLLNRAFVDLGVQPSLHDARGVGETQSQPADLEQLLSLLNQILRQSDEKHFGSPTLQNAHQKSHHPVKRVELRLERCVQQFYDTKFREVGLSAQQQYRTSLSFLVGTLGPAFDVRTLDHSSSQLVKSKVLALSSGRKNGQGAPMALSVKSVNKYLTNMSTFCDWLVEQRQLLPKNPFSGSLLKMDSRNQMRRRAFELSESLKILEYRPTHKLEAVEFRDAANWLPAIALYSGMRLNEIAGLQLRDIRQEDNIWFFDLSNHRLKTDNSNRYIPIHSELVQRGLLLYVEQQRSNGHTALFPDLNTERHQTSRDGVGSSVGKWFNRTLLARIGIDKDREKERFIMVDFHCCRYTVASQFKFHGIPAYIAKQILGHELDGDITWGTYAGNVSTKLAALKSAIEVLSYEKP